MYEGRVLCIAEIEQTLSSLREWLNNIEPHLSYTAPTALTNRRPISSLHVRYWSVVILVTRPFLLCMLLRRKELQGSTKLDQFEKLGKICIDAAIQSLTILLKMAEDYLLSCVVVSDFYFALELLQVLSTAHALQVGEGIEQQIHSCVEVLKLLGSGGYCKMLLPEVIYQMTNCNGFQGIFGGAENPENSSTTSQNSDPKVQNHNMYVEFSYIIGPFVKGRLTTFRLLNSRSTPYLDGTSYLDSWDFFFTDIDTNFNYGVDSIVQLLNPEDDLLLMESVCSCSKELS